MESGTVETTSSGTNGATTAPVTALPSGSRSTTLRPAAWSGRSTSPPPRTSPATVARVRGNQPAWEALGNDGRYLWLGKLRDWILDNLEEISDSIQAETGKVRGDISSELLYVAELINFYGRNAEKFIGEETVRPQSALVASKKLVIQYRPHPVVGVISPWNFPLSMALG